MNPFYRDAAFWMTVVSALAAVIGGIFSEAEVELFCAAGAIVIGYLVKVGVVQRAEVAARHDWVEGFRAGVEAAGQLTEEELEEV